MSDAHEVTLYSYWRSTCSWRTRIALHTKGVEFTVKPVHLVKEGGEQHRPEYKEKNPLSLLPTLVYDGQTISDSTAIIEFLNEKYDGQGPDFFPRDPLKRAKVRQLCQLIGSSIQPIQNLSVLKKVSADFGEEHKFEWAKYWIIRGFEALETLFKETSGTYSYGDEITAADFYLVPQVYNAKRFGVDVSAFPTINRVCENCDQVDAFKKARPEVQIDCPET
eukprot:gb/GECH01011910.1/.p1 GENE.gb/GECH01011910.1/~~gb/GECH01011910.1/.p1  ORF type:complete len:221 (+),score=45.73 gb/GECH01011910.1/:1-663(+)